MGRITNVSPEEWRKMLRRADELKGRALFDPAVRGELACLTGKIRALGNLPADGS